MRHIIVELSVVLYILVELMIKVKEGKVIQPIIHLPYRAQVDQIG